MRLFISFSTNSGCLEMCYVLVLGSSVCSSSSNMAAAIASPVTVTDLHATKFRSTKLVEINDRKEYSYYWGV